MSDNKKKTIAAVCLIGCVVVGFTLAARAQTDPAQQSETAAPTSAPANPPQNPAVSPFVSRLDAATRAIHENAKQDESLLREGCRGLLNEILDFAAMAQSLNAALWEQMTPAQRDAFRNAFEQRMVRNCVGQFANYDGESLELAGVRKADDGDLLATTRVGPPDDAKFVTWRLRSHGDDNWRAVDIITEGRSAILDAQNEFAAVFQSVNGDIDALITALQK